MGGAIKNSERRAPPRARVVKQSEPEELHRRRRPVCLQLITATQVPVRACHKIHNLSSACITLQTLCVSLCGARQTHAPPGWRVGAAAALLNIDWLNVCEPRLCSEGAAVSRARQPKDVLTTDTCLRFSFERNGTFCK